MNFRKLILSIGCLTGIFFSSAISALNFYDSDKDPDLLAQELFDALSDEEKVGQLFLVTYPGNEMTADLKDWIIRKHLGGIKIFGWNATEIAKLVRTIEEAKAFSKQTKYSIPLIVSTDQEGGWVQHIRDGMSASVGNLGVSATNSPWDSYQTGLAIGRELRMIGVNMNFAPTVDLYTNYRNLVIGPRSFSADPKKVALFALAYYKGLKEAGVIATAKHFPGHGEATEDSHGVLPEVDLTRAELEDRELLPYKVLIQEGLPAVMGGHLLFPKISRETTSLSPVFLQTILGEELGFKRIVLTDDLIMGGASVRGLTPADVAEKAIRAGNTLLLASMDFRTLETIRQHFLELMESDKEFSAMVDEAVSRNLAVKLEYLQEETDVDKLTASERLENVPLKSTTRALQGTAIRSVTMVRLEGTDVSKDKKTLLISTYQEFITEGQKFFKDAEGLRYAYLPLQTPSPQMLWELQQRAPKYDQIIFNLTTPASLRYLQILRPWNEKLTVISSLSPIFLERTPWLERCIIVYGMNAPSFRAGFWALMGEYSPAGILPLDIKV